MLMVNLQNPWTQLRSLRSWEYNGYWRIRPLLLMVLWISLLITQLLRSNARGNLWLLWFSPSCMEFTLEPSLLPPRVSQRQLCLTPAVTPQSQPHSRLPPSPPIHPLPPPPLPHESHISFSNSNQINIMPSSKPSQGLPWSDWWGADLRRPCFCPSLTVTHANLTAVPWTWQPHPCFGASEPSGSHTWNAPPTQIIGLASSLWPRLCPSVASSKRPSSWEHCDHQSKVAILATSHSPLFGFIVILIGTWCLLLTVSQTRVQVS